MFQRSGAIRMTLGVLALSLGLSSLGWAGYKRAETIPAADLIQPAELAALLQLSLIHI